MGNSIRIRVDEPTRKRLAQLVKQLGWSPSEVVREGLRVLAACRLGMEWDRIIGLGKFASGIPTSAPRRNTSGISEGEIPTLRVLLCALWLLD
jgi:hypothetical protein